MFPIIYVEETTSTNTYLKELSDLQRLEEGTVVYTKKQTAGRGQRGNRWESTPGKNLTFSMILFPHFISGNEQFIISQFISLAVMDCLKGYISHVSVKWPNDIYWKDKKMGGILIENDLTGTKICRSVIGIGLNINQEVFEKDAPNPVSLLQITGMEQDPEELLSKIINNIEQYYEKTKAGKQDEIITLYKKSLFRNEGYYLYHDGKQNFSAKIVEIEPSGILVLQTDNGQIRRFAFKEVEYIL